MARKHHTQYKIPALLVGTALVAIVVFAGVSRLAGSRNAGASESNLSPATIDSRLKRICTTQMGVTIGAHALEQSLPSEDLGFIQGAQGMLWCGVDQNALEVLFYSTSFDENNGIGDGSMFIWKQGSIGTLNPTIYQIRGVGFVLRAAVASSSTRQQTGQFLRALIRNFGSIQSSNAYPDERWKGSKPTLTLQSFKDAALVSN